MKDTRVGNFRWPLRSTESRTIDEACMADFQKKLVCTRRGEPLIGLICAGTSHLVSESTIPVAQ